MCTEWLSAFISISLSSRKKFLDASVHMHKNCPCECESCQKALSNPNVSVELLEMVQMGSGVNTQTQSERPGKVVREVVDLF